MEEDSIEQNKNISGLSFKDLSPQEQDLVLSDSNNGGFLFVNDDIEERRLTKTFSENFKKFLKKQSTKKTLLSFFVVLTGYIYSRVRVVWILTSVFFDLVLGATDFVKEKLVRRMFWGRGNFLRSALQAILFIIVLILTVSYIYRKPVVIVASGDTLDTIGVAETDVLVMNATTNTAVPKDRPRRYVEQYTVKGGDTLSKIAQYYEIKVETLLWANKLTEKSVIKPGMTLQVPPRDGVLVTVKKGDTLESLAKKYSADAADIVDHNWLEKPYKLAVGTELFLPNGELPAEKKPVYASSPSFYRTSSVGYTATAVDPNVGRFLYWPVGGPSAISRGFFPGHYGIDIYPTGGKRPNVIAASGGRVISAGWGSGKYYGFGYYAHVDHGNGYTTLYAHMDKLYVRAGQSVSRGSALGLIGDTGVAYGVHVHFELRRGAELSGRINPRPYMK